LEPEFVERPAVVVAGVLRKYSDSDVEDAGFQDIWMRGFMPRYGEIEPLCEDKGFYGVWFGDIRVGAADYLAGAAVTEREAVPDDLAVREIPAARYAVFRCTVGTIGETYDAIFGAWMVEGGYDLDPELPHFEYYPPETASQESPVFIYVPVAGGRAS